MNVRDRRMDRVLFLLLALPLTWAILHVAAFERDTARRRRVGRGWVEGLSRWEAGLDERLAGWEGRQAAAGELLAAPRGVGYVALLGERGPTDPGEASHRVDDEVFEVFRRAGDLARQGAFMAAVDLYRPILEEGNPRARARGVPVHLVAWLRCVELLAHVDARSSMLAAIEIGSRVYVRTPLALEAAEMAQAVRVVDRVLRRNDEAPSRPDLSPEAIDEARRRAEGAYGRLRMLVKALSGRRAWLAGLAGHVDRLSRKPEAGGPFRYGFLSLVGGAPVLNVLRRVGERRLVYSFDPGEVLPAGEELGGGEVFSVSFDRVLLASRSIEGAKGRSRSYATDEFLPGLCLHVLFPEPGGVPVGEVVLSPARRPPEPDRAGLDLVEAMYLELGRCDRRLAVERYRLALAAMAPDDPRRAAAVAGAARCSR